jgi:hypothetical protein
METSLYERSLPVTLRCVGSSGSSVAAVPWSNTCAAASRLPASVTSLVASAAVFWPNGSVMSPMPSWKTPLIAVRPCTTKPLAGDTRRPSASSWKLPERV